LCEERVSVWLAVMLGREAPLKEEVGGRARGRCWSPGVPVDLSLSSRSRVCRFRERLEALRLLGPWKRAVAGRSWPGVVRVAPPEVGVGEGTSRCFGLVAVGLDGVDVGDGE